MASLKEMESSLTPKEKDAKTGPVPFRFLLSAGIPVPSIIYLYIRVKLFVVVFVPSPLPIPGFRWNSHPSFFSSWKIFHYLFSAIFFPRIRRFN